MPDYKIEYDYGISLDDINGLIDGFKELSVIDRSKRNEDIIDTACRLINKPVIKTTTLFVTIENLYRTPEQTDIVKELMGKPDADPYQIAKEINATNKGLLKNLWEGLQEQMLTLSDNLDNKFMTKLFGKDHKNLESFLNTLISQELIDEESKKALQNMMNLFPGNQLIMGVLVVFTLLKTFIAVNAAGTAGTLTKKLNSMHTPGSPDPGSVIRAAFLDESLSPEVRRVMKENGLGKADQDLMFISQYATFDPDTIQQLFLRGFIPEDQMIHRLKENGYTPERIGELTQLFDILPPLQDISTMMTKEAFEEDQIGIMGLDRELPGSFVKYAGQHGLSAEWARRYWIIHWQQPGLELMFQAYQRRFITESDLKVFMKTIEIPPYLRDVMMNVAYRPLTRIDVRRMYEDGILDLEQVYSAYLDHGYSPENATLMTQWTIRYAEPNEKELSRAQITDLMIDGHLSREDAKNMLQKLGYPEHRADLLITYAEYKEIKDEMDEAIDNVKIYFQNNLISKEEARQRLYQLNVPSDRVTLLIERWNIKNISDTKLPSKSDLDKFYRKGIIDDTNYIQEMSRLGYSNKYIGWYLSNLKESA